MALLCDAFSTKVFAFKTCTYVELEIQKLRENVLKNLVIASVEISNDARPKFLNENDATVWQVIIANLRYEKFNLEKLIIELACVSSSTNFNQA